MPKPTPWALLPTKVPRTENPELGYFYDNVAKPLISDTVRLMGNGLPIDLQQVQELENTLDVTIARVHEILSNNKIVKDYQKARYDIIIDNYKAERLSKCKSVESFMKPFNHKDMSHRSYFMYFYGQKVSLPKPDEELPMGIPKWAANAIKKIALTKPILKKLLAGDVTEENNDYAKQAVLALAEYKAELQGKKFRHQAETLEDLELPPFNPGSPDQKHDILTGMLGYASNKLTDSYETYERECNKAHRQGYLEPPEPKNRYSWNRENVEILLKFTNNDDEKELFQAFVDYSMGAIIKNNFIQAFYKFTVEGRLHGHYSLLGAKTG